MAMSLVVGKTLCVFGGETEDEHHNSLEILELSKLNKVWSGDLVECFWQYLNIDDDVVAYVPKFHHSLSENEFLVLGFTHH